MKSETAYRGGSALSVRAFARSLHLSEKTIRNAIHDGRIPREALVEVRAVNGRRSHAIADPRLAARAWAEVTALPRGGRISVPAEVAPELAKLRLARERRGLEWFVTRERARFVDRAAARDALDAAAEHAVASCPPEQQQAARRVAGRIKTQFLRELKKR